MRSASAAASSAGMPSRFMPVSKWSAAPPRHPLPVQNASHSASSWSEVIAGRIWARAKGAALGEMGDEKGPAARGAERVHDRLDPAAIGVDLDDRGALGERGARL